MKPNKKVGTFLLVAAMCCIVTAKVVTAQDQAGPSVPANEHYSVSFSGVVDAIDEKSNLLDGSVTKGTEISGHYCINTDDINKINRDQNQTIFHDAVGIDCFEMRIGNYTFRPEKKADYVSRLTIADNLKSFNDTVDFWSLDIPSVQVIDNEIKDELGAYIHFSDIKGDALKSKDFVPSPNLPDFTSRRVGISRMKSTRKGTTNTFLITGEITSMR